MTQENRVHVGLQWLPHYQPLPVLFRSREKPMVLVYTDPVKLKQESRLFSRPSLLNTLIYVKPLAWRLVPSKNQLP